MTDMDTHSGTRVTMVGPVMIPDGNRFMIVQAG
jgi:hypothetical protein